MKIVTIPEETLNKILAELKAMRKELAQVKKTLAQAPPYGSDEWWEWSTNRGLEDVKQGRYKTFDSFDDYIKDLEQRL